MANRTTTTVGGNRNGNQNASGQRVAASVGISLGWPTERWVALIVLMALGLLILIRVGFRGLGFQGNIGGRITV